MKPENASPESVTRWYHVNDGTECVAGHNPQTMECAEGGDFVAVHSDVVAAAKVIGDTLQEFGIEIDEASSIAAAQRVADLVGLAGRKSTIDPHTTPLPQDDSSLNVIKEVRNLRADLDEVIETLRSWQPYVLGKMGPTS